MFICVDCRIKNLSSCIYNEHKVVYVSDLTFEIPKKSDDRAWKKMLKWTPGHKTVEGNHHTLGDIKDTYYFLDAEYCYFSHKRDSKKPRDIRYQDTLFSEKTYSNGVPKRNLLDEFIASSMFPKSYYMSF